LAEAGYPQGLKLTCTGRATATSNDAKVLQAVAQMFSRIGIETTVETMPWATYAAAPASRSSAVPVGWARTPARLVAAALDARHYDREQGHGHRQSCRYSNPR